uniref:Uncharacterized protein n=1 Tax=Trichuris muris TaxID=70415 RepID=A0A5S6QIY3_TRIMR
MESSRERIDGKDGNTVTTANVPHNRIYQERLLAMPNGHVPAQLESSTKLENGLQNDDEQGPEFKKERQKVQWKIPEVVNIAVREVTENEVGVQLKAIQQYAIW